MSLWLKKAANSQPNGTGLADGGQSLSPGSSYPGQGQLFLVERGNDVYQKKRRKKRESPNQRRVEMLQMRSLDPRAIVPESL